jgi:hypothetical protein
LKAVLPSNEKGSQEILTAVGAHGLPTLRLMLKKDAFRVMDHRGVIYL